MKFNFIKKIFKLIFKKKKKKNTTLKQPLYPYDQQNMWTCSMGNLHSNNQQYCQCIYISAINKLKI